MDKRTTYRIAFHNAVHYLHYDAETQTAMLQGCGMQVTIQEGRITDFVNTAKVLGFTVSKL